MMKRLLILVVAAAGPTNLIAWSAGVGGVWGYRSISVGFFGGWDFPVTGQTGWAYAHQFWLGFGIGVNLGMFASGNAVN